MNRTLFLIVSVLVGLDLAIANSLVKVRPYLQIHMLDVGQGDAVLIITPEQNHILVDGGPGNSVLVELSEVLPYMFSEIDLLVLTHPHLDHMEGLVHVLDRFDVGAVLMSAPDYGGPVYDAFLERLKGKTVYLADDDVDFRFGDTYLDVLYPFEPASGEKMKNINNASPVIMIESNGHRILLSGDAEGEVEEKILELDLKADVMKAGHHGSKTSNSLEYLEAVSPDKLLISVGEGNDYGHPHEETLNKAEDLGIEVLRTDLEGRISIIFDD